MLMDTKAYVQQYKNELLTKLSELVSYPSVMAKGQRLLAILITEHGSTEEKPLGIITLYDLPKILAKLV